MLREEIAQVVGAAGKKELRSFGITMGCVLGLITAFLWWKQSSIFMYFGGVGGAFMALGLIAPILLTPLYKVWMTFAVIMGFFMTRVILSVFYGLVMTPAALIAKMLGKDLLDEKLDPSAKTYWVELPTGSYNNVDTEKQY